MIEPEYHKISTKKEILPEVHLHEVFLSWLLFIPLRNTVRVIRNKSSLFFDKISGKFDRDAINLRDVIDRKD